MPSTLVTLRTPADRLRADQAAELRQMVLGFPGLPELAVRELIATIDGETAAKQKWTFVMLSPEQNAAVVAWLAEHSARPQQAMKLWSILFTALRTDTGEIVLTRDELADRLGVTSDKISELMGELEQIGAISRRRHKIGGMRGRGMVRYFMNPRVATCLTGEARDQAQAAAPPLLRLMEGGKV